MWVLAPASDFEAEVGVGGALWVPVPPFAESLGFEPFAADGVDVCAVESGAFGFGVLCEDPPPGEEVPAFESESLASPALVPLPESPMSAR